MKTSSENIPDNTQQESSEKEMDTSLAATPTNVQIDNNMQSKELDETQMSVAKMPANARDSGSERADTLSTAELKMKSKNESGTAKIEMPS